jgi:competence protein ComEC
MEIPTHYKKVLLVSGLVSCLIVIIYSTFVFINDRAQIVFCDVQQGDAIYIRTEQKQDILIDAGRDKHVLECLSKHMPFYDRNIELAFLSHSDFDHYGGYTELLKRYDVDIFIKNSSTKAKEFEEFEESIKHQTRVETFFAGSSIDLQGSQFISIWPPADLVLKHLYSTTNELSQIMVFQTGVLRVLFTGDIDPQSLFNLIHSCSDCGQRLSDISILKVPHHGAANGLTSQFLTTVHPQLSIISVGKNSYGHPSSSILNLFHILHMKYLRTDEEGDIVIRYDGNSWWREGR